MSVGTSSRTARGKDPVVRGAMMAFRAGTGLALLLGLGMLFGLVGGGLAVVHMGVGFIAVAGALSVAIRLAAIGKGAALVWVAVILMALGAVGVLSGLLPGMLHLVVMLLAVGLGEMAAARAGR